MSQAQKQSKKQYHESNKHFINHHIFILWLFHLQKGFITCAKKILRGCMGW